MLREQTFTLSRGIPELYLLSAEDSHVKNTDPKSYFVARRRAIASNGVCSTYILKTSYSSYNTFFNQNLNPRANIKIVLAVE